MKGIIIIGIVVLALIGGGIYWYNTSGPGEEFVQTCHYTASNGPDPLCTPGDKGVIDLKVLCAPAKYDSKISKSVINEVYGRYGINESDRVDFAIDNLIPLELGGSNDIRNLWPQPIYSVPGYNEKNKAETKLRELACASRIPLASAQYMISHDWKNNQGLWN